MLDLAKMMGLGLAPNGGGIAPIVQQIGTRAEQNLAISGALTTGNQKLSGRVRMYFSQDCNNIQIGFNGFYTVDAISGNGNQCIETNLGHDYTQRVALEYNGMSVAFTWDGANFGTIVNGVALKLTDKLPASAFGLTKFTKGDQAWLRMERTVPVGGFCLYHYANVNSPAITGEQFQNGALSATDMLTNTGDWPRTNGWNAHGVVWLPSCVIGEVTGKKRATAVIGASIEHGAGETGRGDGYNLSGGYIRRGYAANKEAKIMLARATESAASFVANSAKRREYLKYVNAIYTAHGGNDYSYALGVPSTKTALQQIWAWGKAAGCLVHHIGLSVKSDSTDGWATEANQTPRNGFEAGGNWRDDVNTWAAAKVGTEIDSYKHFDQSQTPLAHSGPQRDIWRSDLGVGSTDGTHPTTVVHTAMGTEFATKLEADRVAYEGA